VRRMSEDVQVFDFAIQNGSGAVELRLGDEEYANLQTKKAAPRRVGP
jgi:hypothetical protein